VLYMEIERFWKNGQKKRGPFFLMWGLLRAKNTGMACSKRGVRGSNRTEIRMPCCPRSVDATWRRTNLRSSFTFVYRPGKVGCLCRFSLFCPPTSKGHIFSTAWPIWVNFMSDQRVFRALHGNRAILEEWTKKEGAFLPHVGPFQGLKIPEWHARNMGYGAPTGARFVCTCCPRSVDATWGRTNLRSSLPSSIAPQSRLFVPFFAVLPSNFKRPYLFNCLADLGEFYVKSKGFPCSTWKSSDFGRMDEKRGGLSSSCGAFSGLKIPEWHCS